MHAHTHYHALDVIFYLAVFAAFVGYMVWMSMKPRKRRSLYYAPRKVNRRFEKAYAAYKAWEENNPNATIIGTPEGRAIAEEYAAALKELRGAGATSTGIIWIENELKNVGSLLAM